MAHASKLPKYRIVEDHLRSLISSRALDVGAMLPTEEELRSQFGVSRATVRSALANLQSDGLISRSPAIGSKVISSETPQQFQSGWSSFEDLLQYAENVELSVISSESIVIDEEKAKEIGFAAGRKLVFVDGVRKALGEETATCLLQIYFDVLYSGILEYVATSRKPIAALIEDAYRIRIKSIRQEISATTLSQDEARRLGAEPNSAGLVIKRWYSDTDERIFEMSRSVYAAGTFRYEMELDRSASSAKVRTI